MRWSRTHADTSLGELLDSRPDEPIPAAEAGVTLDDDSATRAPLTEHTDGLEPPEQPTPWEAGAPVQTGAADSFLDDEDYLPQSRRGHGRLTVALVACVVLAAGVLGGVQVEKQLGTTTSAAGFGAGQGAPGGGTGAGSGAGGTGAQGAGATGTGTGGTAQGGAPGVDPSTSASDGASAGAGTGGATTAPTPAVVGTVSSTGKSSLVVTDLGGTKHTVTVTGTTTLTTPYGHGSLTTGDAVAVAGTTGTGGAITATGLTVS